MSVHDVRSLLLFAAVKYYHLNFFWPNGELTLQSHVGFLKLTGTLLTLSVFLRRSIKVLKYGNRPGENQGSEAGRRASFLGVIEGLTNYGPQAKSSHCLIL